MDARLERRGGNAGGGADVEGEVAVLVTERSEVRAHSDELWEGGAGWGAGWGGG